MGLLGPQFIDVDKARPISVPTNRPPSAEFPLGTDSGGRDMLAVIIVGTPQTLRMGLLAGTVGVLLWALSLGLLAGYYGGQRGYGHQHGDRHHADHPAAGDFAGCGGFRAHNER